METIIMRRRRRRRQLKSYVLVHVAPNPTLKKHQSLLGQDHQWLNCYYFSRYHEEL
jgi:hypothetical protein